MSRLHINIFRAEGNQIVITNFRLLFLKIKWKFATNIHRIRGARGHHLLRMNIL